MNRFKDINSKLKALEKSRVIEILQTELGQYEYLNCIIQESIHPKLIGKYEIFENNKE